MLIRHCKISIRNVADRMVHSHALDGFKNDKYRYEDQEDTICETRKSFYSPITTRHPVSYEATESRKATYPYVNRSFGGHVAITEAKSPIPIAIQSKAIWIARRMSIKEIGVRRTVKQVTIGNEPKAVRPNTIEHLDEHVCKIEHQEVKYLPRFRVGEDSLQVRFRQANRRCSRRTSKGLCIIRSGTLEMLVNRVNCLSIEREC